MNVQLHDSELDEFMFLVIPRLILQPNFEFLRTERTLSEDT